ncbi:MAG: arabinofuranosidase catalytic domain-containing protein, partial [Verrucomicrobiota bacterium]
FYSGPRPGTPGSNAYFPMSKKGGVLLGNGGDNGNGSSGTFYEGVMTAGYPSAATTDAVQANIVAAKYDVPPVQLSRVTTFTPGSAQRINVTFTNTTNEPAVGVTLSLTLPAAWATGVSFTSEAGNLGVSRPQAIFNRPIPPGASASASFQVSSPIATGAGFLTVKTGWTSGTTQEARSETATERVRNVHPVKINEVLLGSGMGQFIELHNAGAAEVDISNWSLVSTASQWASIRLATIPAGTKLATHGFYLLGLASSGLAAPAASGDTVINVRSTAGFEAGQEITIDGESRKLAAVGTPAAAMTTVFIPVSTGPWLTIPAGSTNLPVTNAAGFEVGQKIGLDLGGNHEVATVTAVGKAATQTTLATAASAGATSIRLAAAANLSAGDTLTIDTGGRKELAMVRSVSAPASPAGAAPDGAPPAGAGRGGRGGRGGAGQSAEVVLAAPLKLDHATGIDVSSPGTGISFTPATKFAHPSGDAVQALGGGLTFDRPLASAHAHGAPVLNSQASAAAYQGPPAPNQWFGSVLATGIGSLALLDASGKAVVDAIVYGEQQSSSSARGIITSPELATLEGDQGKGGNIVVMPAGGRGGRGRGAPAAAPVAAPTPNRSAARITDGLDTDNLSADFQLQAATPGAPNQRGP